MSDRDVIPNAQYDDGSLTADDLIADYEQGINKLRQSVADLTPDQLRLRPIPGKWSILEVVCHIADCEQFFSERMKRTIAIDRPLLLGVDGSQYPEPLMYHQRDLDEELELVAVTRRQMVRILRLVPPHVWQKTAVHSETGLVSLRQLLLHGIRHLDHHLPFVAEKRAAFQ